MSNSEQIDTQQPYDQWKPTLPDLVRAGEILSEAANTIEHYVPDWGDSTTVDTVKLLGCEVYSALQTEEHTDDNFLPWTVLMILKTNGHTITVDDGSHTMTPEVGELVVFELHKTHVLDLPDCAFPEKESDYFNEEHMALLSKDYVFVIGHLDLDTKPTREEAEALMLDRLKPALENAYSPSPR